MKRITRTHTLKFIGYQVCLLLTLILVQMGLQFAQSYRWVGFEKKDQSTWVGIAETAEANYSNCQSDLDTMKAARDAANSDIK